MLLFSLVDGHSLVLSEGKLVSVQDVVAKKRENTPDAGICYRAMAEGGLADEPQFFKLRRTHD
eukprot:11423929-Alexandrium_andersonii.AAC.1